jgi:ribonucleoside-diphosphate reductase subunit M1
MQRLEANLDWSLMCPSECPGLVDAVGSSFVELYETYERQGKARKTLPAQKLWQMILDAQIQTGTPYILYKDACNRKSNQQHLGTITSSNLCAAIVEYTSPKETAVCNLGSVALSRFVREDRSFDFDTLRRVTSTLAKNLNIVIDRNYNPTPECFTSNSKNRPIGIGVQGLADVFAKMRLSWTSDEARSLHREIFENMYYAAMSTSAELAAAGAGSNVRNFEKEVHSWNPQLPIWRRSPKE